MKIKGNDIEITPNMDLGAYSPLELAEEQYLNEVSNKLLSNYMKKAKSMGREKQYDAAKKHALDTANQQYQFKVRDLHDPNRAYFMFSLDFKDGYGFIIEVYYVDTVDMRNSNVVYLTPETPLYQINGEYVGVNTPVGYMIKNMRAGERMKFNELCKVANELNGNGEEEKESEQSIRSMIREGLAELAGEQFAYQLGPDSDVVYGKDERGFFVYTKHNLGVKYFNTPEEAEEYARKIYKAIRLRKNAERQEFDRQISLDENHANVKKIVKESIQKHLVDVMKRYTQGNATAEEANKAIMDLADSSVKDKKINESKGKKYVLYADTMKSGNSDFMADLEEQLEKKNVKRALDYIEDEMLVYDGKELTMDDLSKKGNVKLNKDGYAFVENKDHQHDYFIYKEKTNINESYAKDGNYTHFAVHKTANKIVNGWDYSDHENEELRQFAKDYFYQDLIDYELDPKQYTILTIQGCRKRGIDPYDDSNWANGYDLNEAKGKGTDPYYGEKHDMENKKIENQGNMTWTNFKK